MPDAYDFEVDAAAIERAAGPIAKARISSADVDLVGRSVAQAFEPIWGALEAISARLDRLEG